MNELVLSSENTELLPENHSLTQVDFPTTVQVTLAKRILRPGSNKILCLAAQTSVPLHEDELASVSDLGLKLSDGTNVRLSLSSFNDQRGGRPIGHPALSSGPVIERVIYDPARYEPNRFRAANNTPILLAGLSVIGATALLLTGVLTTWTAKHPQTSHKSSRIRQVKSTPRILPGRPAITPVTVSTLKPAERQISNTRQKQASVRTGRSAQRTMEAGERKPKATSNSRQSKPSNGAGGSKNFFIPPPPPVVPLMQYGYPASIPSYPAFVPAPGQGNLAQPPAKIKPNAPVRTTTVLPDPPVVRPTNTSGPSSSAPLPGTQTMPTQTEHKQHNSFEPVAAAPAASPATASGAPVPGNHNDSYRMERIIWPEDRIH